MRALRHIGPLVLILGGCARPSTTPPAPPDMELAATAPVQLSVLTYNVFLRPEPVSYGDKTSCRAERIGKWLSAGDADIVALTETFHRNDTAALTDQAADRFPFRVLHQPPGTGLLGVSGGLSILSRWPVEKTRTLTYSKCSGLFSDCVAAKGALHAVVRLSTTASMNVVATHLDAGDWKGDRTARAAQIEELRAFIAEIDSADGPTIVLGDFNIDALAKDGEYEELRQKLDVTAAAVSSPSTLNCRTTIRCEEQVLPQRLDYVFSDPSDPRLKHTITEHLPLEDRTCGSRFLSDHQAVRTTFAMQSW